MNASIWDQILTRIETKVNRHSFYTWFKPTTFLADGGSSITVRVPNPLFKDWLTKHYSGVLAEALAERMHERVRREFCDMRGFSPTIAQATRLFHLADDECREIFRQLLREGFLVLCADDRYRLRSHIRSAAIR